MPRKARQPARNRIRQMAIYTSVERKVSHSPRKLLSEDTARRSGVRITRLCKERSGFDQERTIVALSCSAVDLPYLRYFRAGPKFNFGVSIAPDYLGDPNDLENSEDCRSAGGHGNQHVRLRGASIDASKRSARLRQRLVAAGRASCTIPRKFSSPCSKSKAWILPKGTGIDGCRKAIRSSSSLSNLHSKRSHGSPMVPASC